MATVVLAHANGYPPGSYRALLAELGEPLGHAVQVLEHRPLWDASPAPTFLGWEHYANDLIDFIERQCDQPVWLLGHSMGAACGVIGAACRPDLFAGIIGLDPVMVRTKIWFWSRVFNRVNPDAMPIVKRALKRPHHFDSHQQAFDFYRGKRVFSNVGDEVLMDYVLAGHALQDDGRVALRYTGAWEACVYRSVPRMGPALKSLRCPLHIIAGDSSDVLTPETLSWAASQYPRLTHESLPGGHLLPLEHPEACAMAVRQKLDEWCGG